MTEQLRPTLSDYLIKHYGNLKRRLTHLLGNADLADDALQDTWVRLHAKGEEPVQSPAAYLLRMASNIAVDGLRRESRFLSLDELNDLMERVDPTPGPDRVAEARADLSAVANLVARLPDRRRRILLMVRVEGMQQKEVAALLGVSVGVVEHELRRAHDFLDEHMHADENNRRI